MRICALTLEVVIGFIALLLVVCGFLFWRLVEGPLSLDFLTPLLVQAFDAQDQAGSSATITGTRLVWDEKRQTLELQVTGLTVDDAQGVRSFALPLANIDFSFGSLLQGKVEVTGVEMIGARLTVRRNENHTFQVLLFQNAGSSPPPSTVERQAVAPTLTNPGQARQARGEVALTAIDALLSGGGLGPIKDLRTVSLKSSEIVVDDRVLGFSWYLPAHQIVLRRTANGLSGEIDVGLPLATQTAEADLAFVFNKVSGTLDIAGQISELNLATLSTLLPQVQGLTVLESEVNGDISATLGDQGEVFFVDFELAMGPGQLRPAMDALPPVPISGGKINGRIDLASDSLSIYDARVQTGTKEAPGPEIATTVSVTQDGERHWDMKVTAQVGSFAVEQLSWLWPAVYAESAHSWVTDNITGGLVHNLTAALDLGLSPGGVQYQNLSGGFDFENLTLHYLRPMPPMQGLTGHTKVTKDRMIFDVRSGSSEGLDLGPGTVTIYDLAAETPSILIEMPVSGSLADMFAVLNQPRLALISKAGIERQGAKGQGKLDVTMGFPLLNDLTSDQMSLTAKGRFRDVLVRRVVLGQDIASPSMLLTSDLNHLTIDGEAEIAGSRVEVSYDQKFSGWLSLKGRGDAIKASTLTAMVPALQGVLGGEVAGSFIIEGNPSRRMTIDLDTDLARTSVEAPFGDWTKVAGTPGRLSGQIVLEDGDLIAFDNIDMTAPGLSFAGSVAFGPDSVMQSAHLSHARYQEFDLSGIRVSEQDNVMKVTVDGGTIDIRSWISDGEDPLRETDETLGDDSTPHKIDVTLNNISKVLLPNGELRGVQARVENSQAFFFIDLTGTLWVADRSAGPVSFSLLPDNNGGKHGKLTLADTGAMLLALDLGDYIQGGDLTWTGSTPAGQPKAPLAGHLSVGPFHLKEVPPALKVIMVAGLTGIEDALSGPGVNFDKLTGDLTVKGDSFSTKQLRAIGAALGVLASGSLDVSADTIDLEGKVVPAQAINSFLDKIPVLGWVITGGENQGLFAVNYDVEGSLKDPRITVNPISALTPPVLRSLVEAITDDSGSHSRPPTEIPEPKGPQR